MGIARNFGRNIFHSFRPVVNGVHSAHGGHKGCGGTYIGSGFFPFDMLFAGLEGQPYGGFAQTIHGYAYDPAGDLPFIGVFGSHEPGCRASEPHRESETLCGAYGHVGAPGRRLFQYRQRQQVAIGGYERTVGMGFFTEFRVVAHLSVGCRILDDGSVAQRPELVCFIISCFDFYA